MEPIWAIGSDVLVHSGAGAEAGSAQQWAAAADVAGLAGP